MVIILVQVDSIQPSMKSRSNKKYDLVRALMNSFYSRVTEAALGVDVKSRDPEFYLIHIVARC